MIDQEMIDDGVIRTNKVVGINQPESDAAGKKYPAAAGLRSKAASCKLRRLSAAPPRDKDHEESRHPFPDRNADQADQRGRLVGRSQLWRRNAE